MFTPSIRALHRMVSGSLFDEVEAFIGRKLGAEERHGLSHGEHAGTWETSWYLAQRPEWVASDYKSLAEDHPPPLRWLARLADRLEARRGSQAGQGLGLAGVLRALSQSFGWLLNARFGYGRGGQRVSYSGWPAVASADVGRAYAELPVRMCLEDLEAVTQGTLDPVDVRSIASEPAVIQPHFGSLVAAGTLGLGLLGLWLLF
jgi:hypothetical protein